MFGGLDSALDARGKTAAAAAPTVARRKLRFVIRPDGYERSPSLVMEIGDVDGTSVARYANTTAASRPAPDMKTPFNTLTRHSAIRRRPSPKINMEAAAKMRLSANCALCIVVMDFPPEAPIFAHLNCGGAFQ